MESLLDPRTFGLLNIGLSMMQGAGPSKTPQSFGSILGGAGQDGMKAFMQANQANQQSQLFGLKMAEAQREASERAEKGKAFAQLSTQFPELAPLFKFAPQVAAARAFPEPEKPAYHRVGDSLVRTEPGRSPAPVFEATKPPETATDANGILRYKTGPNMGQVVPGFDAPRQDEFTKALVSAGIQPDSPQALALFKSRLGKLATHAPAPSATVVNKQETEFGKAVGKEMGQMYAGLLQSDMNAPATVSKYQRLSSLLSQSNPGKFKGTTTEIKAAAKGLGIDLEAIGVKDDVAPAQAARSLANQLALELRNPAGGAGMPGAMSDKDREFLVQMIPSLESDPGAISKMIEYRVKLAQREQKVARMARDYRRKNNRFDEGFFDELKDWADRNPLFSEGGVSAPALSPETQRLLNRFLQR